MLFCKIKKKILFCYYWLMCMLIGFIGEGKWIIVLLFGEFVFIGYGFVIMIFCYMG